MSEFYIAQNGTQSGPLPITEIAELYKKGELAPTDYIYDQDKGDWVLASEFGPLGQLVKAAPPPPFKAPPKPKEQEASPESEHSITEWYILKGENKFGPFSISDVIKMLQQKAVFEYDFVWHPGLASWKRVAEMKEFSAGQIRALHSSESDDVKELFFRRRHRRLSYNGTLIIHDNKSVWKGHGIEISAGGAGVIMENATLVPGQTLYLHFKPCDGVPPFNAVCEVVSKQFVEGVKDRTTPIRYGLKFTNVNPSTQQLLHEMAQRSEAA